MPRRARFALGSGREIVATLLVSGVSLGLINSASASSLFPFETIALSGQAAPGMPAGATWNQVGVARLNSGGDAILLGTVVGGGTTATDDGGIWTRSAGGAYTLIAREGDAAPGAPGGTLFGDLGIDGDDALRWSDAGEAAVRTGLTGGTSAQGIFGPDSSGALTLLARDGAPAPGTGVEFGSLDFGSPIVGASGSTLFSARLAGAGVTTANDSAIFLSQGGSVSLLNREGDAAPGASDTFGSLLPTPVFNQGGEYAFPTTLQSSGDAALFGPDATGDLMLRARSGDAAPGLPPGGTFTEFDLHGMNDAGRIAFTATVSGVLGTEGLFTSDRDGSVASVARTDDPVPGGALGETYSNLTTFSLNQDGDLSFASFLAGNGVDATNDKALFFFSEASGTVALRARGGDAVNGLPIDITLDDVNDQSLNLLDQIVFAGTLQGSSVDAGNDDALFLSEDDGGLFLILREGDLFEVAPGDERTISAFDVADAIFSERAQESWNDASRLVVSIDFTDGTEGVFLFAVPEPASGALLALGLLGLTARARRGLRGRVTIGE